MMRGRGLRDCKGQVSRFRVWGGVCEVSQNGHGIHGIIANSPFITLQFGWGALESPRGICDLGFRL